GEIAVRLLDQPAIAESENVAAEGERVVVPPLPFRLAGEIEEMGRLADEVEGDVGEAEVDFHRRRVAAPLGEALAEDQGIVAQAEEIFEQRRAFGRRGRVEGARAGGGGGEVDGWER